MLSVAQKGVSEAHLSCGISLVSDKAELVRYQALQRLAIMAS